MIKEPLEHHVALKDLLKHYPEAIQGLTLMKRHFSDICFLKTHYICVPLATVTFLARGIVVVCHVLVSADKL